VPARKPRRKAAESEVQLSDERSLAIIARLLALLLVKGEAQGDAVVTLNLAGFNTQEIASLLGTSANVVAVTVYKNRKGSRSTSRKRAAGVRRNTSAEAS
jgi:hypothetical protein